MTDIIPIHNVSRQCGTCTRCCEGWLEANILGQDLRNGKNCQFLKDSSCSIYADRPHEPCRNYTCAWLDDTIFPDWLKPHLSNVIITKKVPDDVKLTHYTVVETGVKMDATVLNWIILWSIRENINLIYCIDGEKHCLGDEHFYNEIVSKVTG